MSKREKIMDDVTRIAGGAIEILGKTGSQASSTVRAHIDNLAHDMDLVPREDFERLELMLTRSREDQEKLEKRIEYLEKQILKN